jgi:hypothetical protein
VALDEHEWEGGALPAQTARPALAVHLLASSVLLLLRLVPVWGLFGV